VFIRTAGISHTACKEIKMEIFVIYNKTSGYLDGGAGRINQEWDATHKDGSTVSESILRILAKDPNRAVVYLPNQTLPDPEKHKIKDGKIVELTKDDQTAIEAAKPKSELDKLTERVAVLETKKLVI